MQRDLARNWAIMAKKEAADVKKSMDASQRGFQELVGKMNDQTAVHRKILRSTKMHHATKVSGLEKALATERSARAKVATHSGARDGQLARTQKELQGMQRLRHRNEVCTRELKQARAENEALRVELLRAEAATLEANTRSARCASQSTKLQEEADKWQVAMRQLAEDYHNLVQTTGSDSERGESLQLELNAVQRRHHEEKKELYAELSQWKERASDVQRLKDFLETSAGRAQQQHSR